MYCYICNKILVGQYYYDVWGHKICASHLNNDVVNCSSCSSFTTKENTLADGRILCPLCTSLIVKPNDNIVFLKNTVVNALAKVGFVIADMDKIPIDIVSFNKLANISNTSNSFHIKGYTSYEFTTYSGLLSKTTKQEKYKIYVLTHLTSIEFAGVLAHELLHIWQFQNDIKLLQQKHVEGLCNMGSYLVYDLYLKQNTNNPPYNKLLQIYLQQLKDNPDPVYGDGFREIYRSYESVGWEYMKNIIARYKNK